MGFYRPGSAADARRRARQGTAMVEFAIIAPFLVTLFFGTIGLGMIMGRYVQTLTVARDVAHLYVSGVDFTQTTSQNIALQLAQGTGMTATGGNGVIILSRVATIYQADCDAAGVSGTCNNLGQCVITQRIVLGNAALQSSAFGTPTATLMDAAGNISPSVYLQNTDSSVRTTGFSTLLTSAGMTSLIPQGNSIWVTEVYFTYPDISYLGNWVSGGGAYARFLY